MIQKNLISFLLYFSLLFGSGGFDNGTATGKGKFQLDLTWNPYNKIKFGQTYGVLSFGLTDRIDFHGYLSKDSKHHLTWYSGIFYQFYKTDKIDLATAIGLRKQLEESWTHIFSPQLLYTVRIVDKLSISGSLVNVYNYSSQKNYGIAFDLGLNYKIPVKSNILESVAINVGGFHPAVNSENAFFHPAYSIDFKFK
jgi:hypothetical protein